MLESAVFGFALDMQVNPPVPFEPVTFGHALLLFGGKRRAPALLYQQRRAKSAYRSPKSLVDHALIKQGESIVARRASIFASTTENSLI
jgi:hypothetical protein